MTTIESPVAARVRPFSYLPAILFSLITGAALIGLPMFAYYYDFTWVDWTMFGILYAVTGLGITVGYHRLMAHRSFDCPGWVKVALLIAGGWALENSVLKISPNADNFYKSYQRMYVGLPFYVLVDGDGIIRYGGGGGEDLKEIKDKIAELDKQK